MTATFMFRQAIASFAIGLASVVATSSQAQIFVFSTPGAKCMLTDATTGVVDETFVMKDFGHENSLYNAAVPGHTYAGPITISCSKDGYEPKSVTITRVPMHWISTSAPCSPPPHLTSEQMTTYCLNVENRGGVQPPYSGPPAMEYPRANVELTPIAKK